MAKLKRKRDWAILIEIVGAPIEGAPLAGTTVVGSGYDWARESRMGEPDNTADLSWMRRTWGVGKMPTFSLHDADGIVYLQGRIVHLATPRLPRRDLR